MLQAVNNAFSLPSIKTDSQSQPSIEPTGADVIVGYLQYLGIDVVFGVPGGAIEPLLNALARSERQGGPRLVVARHECGAAFMADGYYRETGKMGAVCSTTGPGATNLLTGVASAFVEEIPMLVITAQTPLPKFGRGALQESSCTAIDTVGMFRYVTRFNTLVSHQEQLENKLISAIMSAHQGTRGPVHLSIPSDVLRAPMNTQRIHNDLLIPNFSVVDDLAIGRLYEKLARVDCMVMYIGSGVGRAAKKLVEFAELTNTPFVTSPTGKSWVDETHPLYRGVYGFAGHDSAQQLLQQPHVELVLAVGTALEELETSGWSADLLNHKLVHIDACADHFIRSPMACLHVFGNIELVFDRLLVQVKTARQWGRQWQSPPMRSSKKNIYNSYVTLKEPEKCLSNEAPVKPQRLMAYLSKALPDNTRLFVDAGNGWSWATHYLSRSNSEGLYRVAMGYGSMAWSIGAAIGSALVNRDAPTVCILGDGSYLMSAQEITVAAQQKLPIVFVVLNDAAMGMVMHGQILGQQESIGWQLNDVNYAAMARAMGVDGMVIERPQQLDLLDLDALFAKSGPTLLDVRIDRDEVPPMGDRIKGLAQQAGSAMPGG